MPVTDMMENAVALHERHRGRGHDEAARDLAVQDRGVHLRAARVGHVHDVDARHGFEQFGGQMG